MDIPANGDPELLLGNGPMAAFRSVAGAGLRFSPSVERITGHTVDEIASDPEFWSNRIHPVDYDELIRAGADAIEHRQAMSEATFQFRAAGGVYRWLRQTTYREYAADESPVDTYGYLLDVTDLQEERRRQDRDAIDRARLDGVSLTAREVAHRLNNANAILNCAFELVRKGDALDEVLEIGADTIATTTIWVNNLQDVKHVAVHETAAGPSLDIIRSLEAE